MNECKDAYDAGILTAELHLTMLHCHTLKTQGGGIVVDLKALRRERVRILIKIRNLDFFSPYLGPTPILAFPLGCVGTNNKILKISGELIGTERGTIIMRQDFFTLELLPVDIEEEAVKAGV